MSAPDQNRTGALCEARGPPDHGDPVKRPRRPDATGATPRWMGPGRQCPDGHRARRLRRQWARVSGA